METRCEGVEGAGMEINGVPFPADYGVWRSIVSSPSGVWGGVPAYKQIWQTSSIIEHLCWNENAIFSWA